MLLFFILLTWGEAPTKLKPVQTFQEPSEVAEAYLGRPYSFDFAPNGDLYIADRDRSKVFVWNKDGTFQKTFGKEGEGPGELAFPVKIAVDKNGVYLWEGRQRFSIFELDGTFRKIIHLPGVEPRNFAPLGDGRFLLGTRKLLEEGLLNMVFYLMDETGEKTILQELPNQAFMGKAGNRSDNDIRFQAFSPELDIQRDEKGQLHFGFSQNKQIYPLNEKGAVGEPKTFEMLSLPVTEEEKSYVSEMSFPGPNGRIKLKEIPFLRIDYSRNKAFYTHFLIKNGKIAFILTPLGSTNNVSVGYHRGTYYINDFKTGKLLSRGSFHYREDSSILFRNGRILGCILNEEDEYNITELEFEGM